MSRARSAAVLLGAVLLGAAGSLLVATALGMKTPELSRLARLLVPASIGTVAIALIASWLLRRTSLSQRYLAIAAVGTVVALGNLLVLARVMFVSTHAATVLAVVLTFATAAGLATAFSTARASATALARLIGTAEVLGSGDLSARVGPLGAGSELDRLGSTMDQMAEALQLARTQEQRIERTRRDLITAVSHDLRTPLANLQAMAEAIDDRVVEDLETLRRYSSEMRRSVGQLATLVDDLFEFVQADSIEIGGEADVATLEEVADLALDAVGPEAHRKGLVLTADLQGAHGAACSAHVARVLQNLLGNAVRHTPPGGSVTVSARNEDHTVRITVDDSGEGIDERDLPHIFEPFYRGDPARSGNGAGLGLALAERLVRAMGGSITASSLPPLGTRFELVIPTGRRPTASREPSGSATTRSDGRRGSGSRRPN